MDCETKGTFRTIFMKDRGLDVPDQRWVKLGIHTMEEKAER